MGRVSPGRGEAQHEELLFLFVKQTVGCKELAEEEDGGDETCQEVFEDVDRKNDGQEEGSDVELDRGTS